MTGFFVLLTNLIQSTTSDQWLTFALSTGGILLMMLCAFRSPVLAVVAIVPNTLPVFMVSGLLGWLGLKINMGSAMIAAASMGLSVDSSAHYITAYRDLAPPGERTRRRSQPPIIASAGRWCFRPLRWSSASPRCCCSDFVPTIYFGGADGADHARRHVRQPGRAAAAVGGRASEWEFSAERRNCCGSNWTSQYRLRR